jgi:regulator of sigma E protease
MLGYLGVGWTTEGGDAYYQRIVYTPLESLSAAVERTWVSTVFTVNMLGRMVTGDVSIKNISGPINIAQIAGESVERGWRYFVGILAVISISLGVLNLLPVPVLDGGQIVYQVVEALKGGPMTERAQILGQQVGILALLLLMSFAFYNDIARLFG